MRLKTQSLPWRQHSIQVVGDQLHELPACHFSARAMHLLFCHCCRYLSIAARTRERARCSRTRSLVSEIASTLRTSAPGYPRTSRSVITSRCLSGRPSRAQRTCSNISLSKRACGIPRQFDGATTSCRANDRRGRETDQGQPLHRSQRLSSRSTAATARFPRSCFRTVGCWLRRVARGSASLFRSAAARTGCSD